MWAFVDLLSSPNSPPNSVKLVRTIIFIFNYFHMTKSHVALDVTKLIFQIMSVTVVVKELLARADKPDSTPGDAVFCFFTPFFFFFFFPV